ncbi:MAG: Flp pilus assembly protein CpaB [Myxococcota bacterium]
MGQTQQTSRLRALIFLGIAGIAAIAAGVVVVQLYRAYQGRLAVAERQEPMQNYIVAASELHQGIEITEDDLFIVEIAPSYLHLDGGAESGLYKNYEQVVGKMPRERILSNEFIREQRLANARTGIGLNAIVPRGQRAIAITAGGGRAVSGFLQPWDYVDVLVTFEPDDGTQPETHYLQQAVLVLGVGSDATRPGDREVDPTVTRAERRQAKARASTVTLAVSPDEAEKIAHAQALGTITLTLRNNADLEPEEGLTGVGVDNLFGVQPGISRSNGPG